MNKERETQSLEERREVLVKELEKIIKEINKIDNLRRIENTSYLKNKEENRLAIKLFAGSIRKN